MNNISRHLVNPFFAYALVYSIVLIIYIIPFSGLYPNIKIDFLFFFLVTIIVSFFLSLFYKKQNLYLETDRKVQKTKYILIYCLILFAYGLDFMYMGAIPLFAPDPDAGYRAFEGIPFFHVLIITGNAFFANVVFEKFLLTKRKIFLILWGISFLPYIFLYTRGSILIGLITASLIFCSYKSLKKKHLLCMAIISLIVLYFFGIAGNIRLNQALYGESINDSDTILNFGLATKEFDDSIVPNEFFWGYIYISSPMANLQNIMIQSEYKNFNINNVGLLVLTDCIPDSISKRIIDIFYSNPDNLDSPPLLTPAFNVSTFYANAGNNLGYFGLVFMYIYYIIFSFFYCVILMRNNKYKTIGIASFVTLVYLSIFNNVFVYAGWAFQLIYPLILGYRK